MSATPTGLATILRFSKRHRILPLAMMMAAATSFQVLAEDIDPHAGHRHHMQQSTGASATQVQIPNVNLLDAKGQPFRFERSTFGDRVVVIDFVYTTCTTICPVLTATMAAVQRRLAEDLGDKVTLVSVSVDPVHDTPARLNEYANTFKAGEDWHWLTGPKSQVNSVLRAFGLTTGAPADHPPVILVGVPAQNRWLRWVGIPATEAVVQEAKAMMNTQAQAMPIRVAKGEAEGGM